MVLVLVDEEEEVFDVTMRVVQMVLLMVEIVGVLLRVVQKVMVVGEEIE